MANFCPNCGQPVNADDVFCESCGTKLGTLNLETPEAVQRAQPGTRFCGECGARQPE